MNDSMAPPIHISLCMIVRDNAATLETSLRSIKPWVDEMVVVDTGSKDDTKAIAERLGARVFDFTWCDDFSAARNESLKHARGTWLFWMDSDDTIAPEHGFRLRQLALGPHEDGVAGYLMQVHYPEPSPQGVLQTNVVDRVKLVRNHSGVRFEGRIHEQLVHGAGRIAATDIVVAHSLADHSPASHKKKTKRNLRLLRQQLKAKPGDPFTLFNLGQTYCTDGKPKRAVDYLRKAIAADSQSQFVRKAYVLLVQSLTEQDQPTAACKACDEGRQRFPEDPELAFTEGVLAQQAADWERAEVAYHAALELKPQRPFVGLDRGAVGFKAHHNLAVIYAHTGRFGQAVGHWQEAVKLEPGFRDAWSGLGEVLLLQQEHDAVAALAEQLFADPNLQVLSLVWKAQLAKARGNVNEARFTLDMARRQYPDDVEPLKALCQLLFESQAFTEAEVHLRELVEQVPEEPAGYENLAGVYLQQQRYADAVELLEQALKRRPHAAGILMKLGIALEKLHRPDEAADAYERVLQVQPGFTAAQQGLDRLAAPASQLG